MTRVVSREKLTAAAREFKQAAERAIRRDIVRGLIELVLNSDDSYRRLGRGDGHVDIRIKKRSGGGATMTVRDDAEGMDADGLREAISEYGRAASGIYDGKSVRGYFGHGLKDAILGLGAGKIVTFRDDVMYMAALSIDNAGVPMIDYFEPTAATPRLRKAYGVAGNGTLVSIDVAPSVPIAQFERLREHVSRHYLLRRVMSDPRRVIRLTYQPVVAAPEQDRLSYREPVVEEVLRDEALEFDGKVGRIVVKKATVALEPPAASPLADGGLLISSETAVFDHQLFRFDGADGAEWFFGEVIVPAINGMLRKDEPILSATRDGLVWSNERLRPLKAAIEAVLAEVVEAERRKRQEKEEGIRNRELRQRVTAAIRELNKIASDELAQVGGFGGGTGAKPAKPQSDPFVPESGFGFVHEFNSLLLEKRASLLVRTDDAAIQPGTVIAFSLVDGDDFKLFTPQSVLEPVEGFPEILEARCYLEGRRPGAECIVTAAAEARRSEAMCRVVTKQPPPPPPKGGLIHDVRFDDRADPRARVRFDKETGDVFVYTMSPSVALYIGSNGERAEQNEGSVLLAELVLDAVCREIARRGVEAGAFIAPEGAEAEAMQREFSRLQNRHGAVIHQCFAGAAIASTRRGRRTAKEEAERAAMPV